MKAYVSDTEDLKQDVSYQDTWDDMIINVSMTDFLVIFFVLFKCVLVGKNTFCVINLLRPWHYCIKNGGLLICFAV